MLAPSAEGLVRRVVSPSTSTTQLLAQEGPEEGTLVFPMVFWSKNWETKMA